MSLRQLCKETSKRPLKVLLYFPQERTTGIAPSRLILGKSFEYKEGSMVTVNWEGKKIQAEIIAMDAFPSDNSSLDKQRFCSVIFLMGSSHICICYCANLPSLCPWLQITKRFSIKKTLSGHPSSFLQLNPIQFPISPNYQSKNRKKASSHGKLKSIQVFIRLVVLISEKKIPLVNDTM